MLFLPDSDAEISDNRAKPAVEHAQATTEDNPSVKFVTKLNALIESKIVTIENINNYEFASRYNLIGYEDDHYYYLIAEQAHRFVKELCDKQGESFPVTTKGLLKNLANDGLIRGIRKERKHQKKAYWRACERFYVAKERQTL